MDILVKIAIVVGLVLLGTGVLCMFRFMGMALFLDPVPDDGSLEMDRARYFKYLIPPSEVPYAETRGQDTRRDC